MLRTELEEGVYHHHLLLRRRSPLTFGFGGVQVPHMAMMNAMGGNNGMMNDMRGMEMMNGMGGGNGGFNSFQGMTTLNCGRGWVSLHSSHSSCFICNKAILINTQPYFTAAFTSILTITGTA